MAKILSVSIPDELKDELESAAHERGTTASELVREALNRYLWESRLRDVQAYGTARAEEHGIGPEDVEALVDEVRAAARAGASGAKP